MLYPMENPIKNYAWGSHTAMNELFGIANPDDQPQAEIWMGAHPGGCSLLPGGIKLRDAVAAAPEVTLGSAARFGGLPFLMKILAAAQPLSIQVHPDKKSAEQGFARENREGLEPGSLLRNYKDDNHKPEIIYALTPFLAMNAFREADEVAALFARASVSVLKREVAALAAQPQPAQLKALFTRVMELAGEEKRQAVAQLLEAAETLAKEERAFALVQEFARLYPEDAGLFAPLLLNVIELAPGEAMFLYARTPHAYLGGTGIEVMANSDNVLRAGLTPKHIDVPELIANTAFVSRSLGELKMAPQQVGARAVYPIPVEDFCFEMIELAGSLTLGHDSAEILLVVEGEVEMANDGSTLRRITGQSAFVDARGELQLNGTGRVARVYVEGKV